MEKTLRMTAAGIVAAPLFYIGYSGLKDKTGFEILIAYLAAIAVYLWLFMFMYALIGKKVFNIFKKIKIEKITNQREESADIKQRDGYQPIKGMKNPNPPRGGSGVNMMQSNKDNNGVR